MSPSLIAETIASLGFPRLRGDEPDDRWLATW